MSGPAKRRKPCRVRPNQCRSAAITIGEDGSPSAVRDAGIVTLVLPETSFLRCFKVIASPVTIAGRCPKKMSMKKTASVRWQRSTALQINRCPGAAVGSCDLLFKHLCGLVAVEFQQMDTKPREHTS